MSIRFLSSLFRRSSKIGLNETEDDRWHALWCEQFSGREILQCETMHWIAHPYSRQHTPFDLTEQDTRVQEMLSLATRGGLDKRDLLRDQAQIRVHQGRFEEAIEILDGFASGDFRDESGIVALRAFALWGLERREQAIQILRPLADLDSLNHGKQLKAMELGVFPDEVRKPRSRWYLGWHLTERQPGSVLRASNDRIPDDPTNRLEWSDELDWLCRSGVPLSRKAYVVRVKFGAEPTFDDNAVCYVSKTLRVVWWIALEDLANAMGIEGVDQILTGPGLEAAAFNAAKRKGVWIDDST